MGIGQLGDIIPDEILKAERISTIKLYDKG